MHTVVPLPVQRMSRNSTSNGCGKLASAKTVRMANNSKLPCSASSTSSRGHSCGVPDRMAHLRRCNVYVEKENEIGQGKGGTRKYLLSSKKTPIYPKIMTMKEYEYFRNQAFRETKEEKEAALEAAERRKEQLIKESMARKEQIRRMDLKKSKQKDGRLSEIDAETRKRTMQLLERAYNMQLEREEEIQKCNRLILETKCRAVRDAQVAEKRLIERELAEEDVRLDNMIENERRWMLKEDEKKAQEEVEKRRHFAEVLKQQILENEEQRLMEFERKQEESRLINLSNFAWQQEEITKMQQKQTENERIRKELAETNEQLKHFKKMEQEENKIIDTRIKEFQRLKAEREAKLAEEQRKENLRREREKERLAVQAEQARELQEQIDELNATRIQEEVEREWRRREKEEALKQAENQKLLRYERDNQIHNKRVMQAIEIEREKREFMKILTTQKEALEREKLEYQKKQQKALMHRSEILKQVNEKERERIQARQKTFEEGLAIRAEAEMRKKKLREAMERKCQEMRENKVPEMYIDEVKRMIESVK